MARFYSVDAVMAEDDRLWSCVQLIRDGRCTQHIPRHAQRPAELPSTHLQLRYRGAAWLLGPAKMLTRLLAKGLIVFVAFIPIKLVLRLLGVSGHDYVTFAFVLYVVALFGSLTWVVALQWLAGPRSQRTFSASLDLPQPDEPFAPRLQRADAHEIEPTPPKQLLMLSQQQTPESTPLRIRGRIDGGHNLMRGTPLLVERWEQRADGIVRSFAALPFAVVGEGQPPVLVELQGCAALWGPYRPVLGTTSAPLPLAPELSSVPAQLGSPAGQVHECVLRHGDEVELIAYALRPSLSSSDAPLVLSPAAPDHRGLYRAEVTGMVVVHPHGHSTVILRPSQA